MPPAPIVIGQEFEWMSVSNGDAGSVIMFATVTNGAGAFTARAVQQGSGSAILTAYKVDGTVLREWLIAPGSRALDLLDGQGVPINLPFSVVRSRVSLSGTPRPFAQQGGGSKK